MIAAQALHWFDQQAFFSEARRVLRPGSALAFWCYGLATITPEIDALVHELYEDELGPFWEPERRLVEDGYRSIVVPFEELPTAPFHMRMSWTLAELVGYFGTWSALQRCIKEQPTRGNPLERMFPRFEQAWGPSPQRAVTWPLAIRAFRL
jgi:SAM-dependent methyltransferase